MDEKSAGPNPTDRGKFGTKRSLLVEGNVVPVSLGVGRANRHDLKLTEPTLESIVTLKPELTCESLQNLRADKGYDYPEVRELLEDWGYTIHIRSKGDEDKSRKQIPDYRARRWVVERTQAWLNKCRRLLIRWEKKT